MLVVAALLQEMWVYTSGNLKDWTRVSTFGPAGSSANNIWEVPELFELPVVAADGSAGDKRWVLIISVNHGALWGGSGVQYFIGNFDGTRFAADVSGTVDTQAQPQHAAILHVGEADGCVEVASVVGPERDVGQVRR